MRFNAVIAATILAATVSGAAIPNPAPEAVAEAIPEEITAETTDRGWISYLNDLHKGRNAGTAWSWFIDIFAGACILFTLTGLLLLQLHARHRPLTWPMVALGVVVPVVLILVFVIRDGCLLLALGLRRFGGGDLRRSCRFRNRRNLQTKGQ